MSQQQHPHQQPHPQRQGQQPGQQQQPHQQQPSTSDYSRLYGMQPIIGQPGFMFPPQQFSRAVTEAGGMPNAMVSPYMNPQTGRPAYMPFTSMMHMPQLVPFSSTMAQLQTCLPQHSTALHSMAGAMPQQLRAPNMVSQDDINRFSAMPQMQKKAPRKGNIQTQEDELAKNIPEITATPKAEPAPKRAKQQRKPRSQAKEGKRSKQSRGTARKEGAAKTSRSKGTGRSSQAAKKATTSTAAAKAKAAAATTATTATAASSASAASEPSLTELLGKYVRHRPAVRSIFYNTKDHMHTWQKKGIPGHYEKPADVRKKYRPPTFDEIVKDEHFEARRTVEAENRQQMVVSQFESMWIDDQDTTEHVLDLADKLEEKAAEMTPKLSKEDAQKLKSSIDFLKNWDTVAQEQRASLERCLRTFEKAADSQQRAISAMVNKHGPKRPRR